MQWPIAVLPLPLLLDLMEPRPIATLYTPVPGGNPDTVSRALQPKLTFPLLSWKALTVPNKVGVATEELVPVQVIPVEQAAQAVKI